MTQNRLVYYVGGRGWKNFYTAEITIIILITIAESKFFYC